jgi:hypothetical protein
MNDTAYECWIDIPECPGYQLGPGPSVWSTLVKPCGPGTKGKPWIHDESKRRQLKLRVSNEGYFCANVRFRGKFQPVALHVLILLTFVGPPPEGCECRHLDGNKLNNDLANLAWGTSQENNIDRMTHGTVPRGDCHPHSKLRESDIPRIRQLLASGMTQTAIARQYNVSCSLISLIDRGLVRSYINA